MSTTRNQSGLPGHIQKHLLNIIEEEGGIKSFLNSKQKFSKLLNKHLATYGARGSTIRRQAGNKLYKWQTLSEGDYLILLHKLQVKPYALRPRRMKESS